MNYKKWKINLLNLNEVSIQRVCALLKFDNYLYKQLLYWVYIKKINDIKNILNISFLVKYLCCAIFYIKKLIIKKKIIDVDNTIKFSLLLDNNSTIETVLIPNRKNHFTLCLSSQSGCMLDCSFCYTGKGNFYGNLKLFEILSQFLIANEIIYEISLNKVITNIVFMGMGEPMFNIKNIIFFIKILINKKIYNFSSRNITVSTSGICDNFDIFKEYSIRVALSLHAPNDVLRNSLMSINKIYPLAKIINKCLIFNNLDLLTIEYIMLKDINDSINCAKELVTLLQGLKCKICLIPFNYFNGALYVCSDKVRIIKFKKFLKQNKFVTTIRKTMGINIYGACGQLSGKV